MEGKKEEKKGERFQTLSEKRDPSEQEFKREREREEKKSSANVLSPLPSFYPKLDFDFLH